MREDIKTAFTLLLNSVGELDYAKLAQKDRDKLTQQDIVVIGIDYLIDVANRHSMGLCKNGSTVYVYLGSHWVEVQADILMYVLSTGIIRTGYDKIKSKYFTFQERLLKQFLVAGLQTSPERQDGLVLINLQNGTYEITPEGRQLREFRKSDFLTYQLPFEYDQKSRAPLFMQFLNEVLPDEASQKVIAEYLGYVFVSTTYLKLEKALLLYGTGANGKSVLFEVINALLGTANVSSFSLKNLTNDNGYYRSMIKDKLINYGTEISAEMNTAFFKQLVSGEPMEARLPYGKPQILTNYAKLLFNCNILPDVNEHNDAYFRRFLIVPFDVTIPKEKQDPELAKKIIDNELSGVFNWVLEGLDRLLENGKLTHSEIAEQKTYEYRQNTNTIEKMIKEFDLRRSAHGWIKYKDLFDDYRKLCSDERLKPLPKTEFKKELKRRDFHFGKKNVGVVVYAEIN